MVKKTVIKGYKAFDSDLSCRGFKYAVGKMYEHKGNISLCESGFHFCQKLADCLNYYPSMARVCEVEALGDVKHGDDKSVTNKIKIVRELTRDEIYALGNDGKNNTGFSNTGDRNTGYQNTGNWNTGERNTGNWNTGNRNTGDQNTGSQNTGYQNTGNWNTGNRNTGDRNTGNRNTGDRNTGDRNTGYWNTGYWNTGDQNTGSQNTGYWNTGDRNTGNWNCTDYSAGFLNSEVQKVPILNGAASVDPIQFRNSTAAYLLRDVDFHTDEVKGIKDPKKRFKAAFKVWWGQLNEEHREVFTQADWFDSKAWKEVTGINVKAKK